MSSSTQSSFIFGVFCFCPLPKDQRCSCIPLILKKRIHRLINFFCFIIAKKGYRFLGPCGVGIIKSMLSDLSRYHNGGAHRHLAGQVDFFWLEINLTKSNLRSLHCHNIDSYFKFLIYEARKTKIRKISLLHFSFFHIKGWHLFLAISWLLGRLSTKIIISVFYSH